MNVLFLTLLDFKSINENGIYTDLMREFVKNKHKVYIVSPTEKRKQEPTRIIEEECKILKIQIGNVQKTNLIEKGISILTLEQKFLNGIKTYFGDVKFDLVIYSTPPITLQKVVEFVKRRDNAKTYLLLKDIFPQNAVDMGMMKKSGLFGFIYKYFRTKEKKLYYASDYIGCMSKANVDFVLRHNPEILPSKVEICPNSIEPVDLQIEQRKAIEIKNKYNIPLDKTTFIYGGNLGKPQGIDFLIECLQSNKFNKSVYFIIAGSGTEFSKLRAFLKSKRITNAQLFSHLPKDDYELLANSCDVGLIFLDKRFTIPNFPSRLLSYMQAGIPILAATDRNTDIGDIIQDGGFGLWGESGDLKKFNENIAILGEREVRSNMGMKARLYLEEHYTSKQSYKIIMNHFN